ncbi:MAG: BatA and WFA domain-containing protein [Bacteroidia bacterium]
MTFLNPGLLWGLLALAVPIIVHFFNLQRPRQILFSNVAFVKEVKKSVVRRLRFRKWLLLLMRMLAIGCLVLAFAQPVQISETGGLRKGGRSVAIVIDDSYSMEAGNERGAYFQQAKSLAREIVNAYGKQHEFLITTTSDPQINANFGTSEEAQQAIKSMPIEQRIAAHSEILGFRKDIFKRSQKPLQELYFLSDFQRSTVLSDSFKINLVDSAQRINYIPLATRGQRNVYVKNLRILSQIIQPEEPVKIQLSITNDGEEAVKELGVRVNLEGKVVAIANENLEPGTTAELELSFTPTSQGWLSGFISLDDYPVEFDNNRYFSLYIPKAEKVLLVEGKKGTKNLSVLYKDIFQQFETEIIPERRLASKELSAYRTVILAGLSDVSGGLAERIRRFLDEGGSMMFFPGENMNLERINAFYKTIKIGSFSDLTVHDPALKANRAELNHPIFKGVFATGSNSGKFDAPNVFRYYPFAPNNTAVQNVIMRMENDAPFLIETRSGKGLVYTFVTLPQNSWTDFQIKSSFVPVVFRATQILNQTQNVQESQILGESTPKAIRTASQDLVRLINTEDGTELIPEQYVQGGATVLNFEPLQLQQGVYSITQGDSVLEKIAFNIGDQESKLAFANSDVLTAYLAEQGYGLVNVLPPQPEVITQDISFTQEGTPLWKWFLAGGLIFLIIEILLLVFGGKN